MLLLEKFKRELLAAMATILRTFRIWLLITFCVKFKLPWYLSKLSACFCDCCRVFIANQFIVKRSMVQQKTKSQMTLKCCKFGNKGENEKSKEPNDKLGSN